MMSSRDQRGGQVDQAPFHLKSEAIVAMNVYKPDEGALKVPGFGSGRAVDDKRPSFGGDRPIGGAREDGIQLRGLIRPSRSLLSEGFL